MNGEQNELDQFLSAEDQDLQNLSDQEFWSWWTLWFRTAQASNADDDLIFNHGSFAVAPGNEHLLEKIQWG